MGIKQVSFAIIVLLLFVGCQPVATPVAVITPTATEVPEIAVVTATAVMIDVEPTASAPEIRYGISASMQNTLPDIVQLGATGELVILDNMSQPDILGNQADMLITYGTIEGWQQSPEALQIALIINSEAEPFANPMIANIVRRSINPGSIAQQLQITGLAVGASEAVESLQLRTDLANAGYPDGFVVELGYMPLPGLREIISQFSEVNIDVQSKQMTFKALQADFASGDVHLGLILIKSPEQQQEWITQIGEANVINLYSVPISYQVLPELDVSFTDYGIPYFAE